MKKKIIIVEKTDTGYSAYSDKYPVFTTGGTLKELAANALEAMNFYLKESGEPIIMKQNLEFKFSISSLFALYPINVKQFAGRIGINYTLLSQYVQGRKEPSQKQTEKIIEGLQEVGKELSKVQIM